MITEYIEMLRDAYGRDLILDPIVLSASALSAYAQEGGPFQAACVMCCVFMCIASLILSWKWAAHSSCKSCNVVRLSKLSM